MATKVFDANSWEFTQRIIRILHNRDVKKWFKDFVSDTALSTGRERLKTCFLIRDADSALEVINKQFAYQTYIKKFDSISAVASFPESWQLKIEAQRPQLIIIFKPANKSDGHSQHSLSLPHYSGDKTPNIKPYTKGNYWARLVLKDNSKIVVNGKTENEAVNQIENFYKYVNTKYKPTSKNIVTGVYKSKPFKEFKLVPVRADFYSQGAKNAYPDWQHYY
ncbi:hypothetical protein STA3757_03870 [Stanieria sp. NIES-3757]|nr:hypothetical protein STA3757_03870 [Stanieria sp. NIES-3757]